MENVTIGGHVYVKNNPTLSCLEDALQKVSAWNDRKPVKKNVLASSLSFLLSGSDMYYLQLMESDEEELLKAYSEVVMEQLRKLQISLSFIHSIEQLAVRDE